MAKRAQEDPLAELEKAYTHWQKLYDHGGSDPTWPDGVNLNLVRNHIISYKRQIEETCPLYMSHELYQRELPPEVDNNYMARADEIREHARQSLRAYLADPTTVICFGIRTALDACWQAIIKTKIVFIWKKCYNEKAMIQPDKSDLNTKHERRNRANAG